MSQTAIFFDLDGTIFDTASDLVNAANKTAQHFGLPEKSYEQLRHHVSNGARAVLAQLFPESQIEQARVFMLEVYEASQYQNTRYFGTLEQTLFELNQSDWLWGIMTNKSRYLSTHLLSILMPWWDQQTLYCGDDFEHLKPHPIAFHCITKAHDITPHKSYYVGDHRKDVVAAKGADWQTIAVDYGYHDKTDPPELWQANYVFQKPQDLQKWLHKSVLS